MLLRTTLRKEAQPHVAREMIRQALHEGGYSYQHTRTWVRTGFALRVRTSGTETTYDEVSKVSYEHGVPNTRPAYAKYADHLALQRSQAVSQLGTGPQLIEHNISSAMQR